MSQLDPLDQSRFDAEVSRVRASGTLGEGGRLVELFEFLAARGAGTASASQAEIAETVFGQTETSIDDATVRVYIHRLRKRLDEYYGGLGEDAGGTRLTLPAGTYALRLLQANDGVAGAAPATIMPSPHLRPRVLGWLVVAVLALAAAFLLGRELPGEGQAPPANALWQPFLDSPRPTLVVVGDYYMFGEIDPLMPERGRLIRDFRVNSPTDLIQLQDEESERYGTAEDVGLNYLPFSVAYGLDAIVPILARDGREVRVLAASDLESDMLNEYDVVYIGLFSGMALLEEINFRTSGFRVGETYDELVDNASGVSYISEEARHRATPGYYRDYGYIARFRAPSGALVALVAGSRDTGLRGVSPLVSGAELPAELSALAGDGDFEALYQMTGQEGADLAERLVVARPRR